MRGCLAVVVCLLVLPLRAAADSPEERANKMYLEGKELMGQGELERAVERFDAAWKEFPHPLILMRRAEAREKLLQYEEAVADYRTYLGRLNPRKQKERREILEQIQALEALLAKPVKVSIVATRPGVMVSVDSAEPKRAPFDEELVPGLHAAEVRDPHFVPAKKEFRVRAAQTQVVRLDAVPRTGQLVIRTAGGTPFAGMQVALDRQPITLTDHERAATQTEPRELVIGAHGLVCTLPGVPDYYTDLDVREGEVTEVVCKLALPTGSALADPWGWVTVGGAAVGIGAGVGLLVSYAADVRRAEDENLELISNKHVFGGISLGLGVALGVSAYFVFARDRGPAATATSASTVVPVFVPAPGGGGLGGVAGGF